MTQETWLEILKTYGLAVLIVLALGAFFYLSLWPWIKARVERNDKINDLLQQINREDRLAMQGSREQERKDFLEALERQRTANQAAIERLSRSLDLRDQKIIESLEKRNVALVQAIDQLTETIHDSTIVPKRRAP